MVVNGGDVRFVVMVIHKQLVVVEAMVLGALLAVTMVATAAAVALAMAATAVSMAAVTAAVVAAAGAATAVARRGDDHDFMDLLKRISSSREEEKQ